MCSPKFKNDAANLRAPGDLLNFDLIHTERNLVSWKMWLADRNVLVDEELRGICLDPSDLAIDAAVRGVGIVLESDLLASYELEAGTLVAAIDDTVSEAVSYYLVYPEENMGLAKVEVFANWIVDLANDGRAES